MIIHFDVDRNLDLLLSGKKFPNEITPQTVGIIKNKDKITVLSLKTQSLITKEVIEAFPRLKIIVTRTVGVDHIDLNSCKERKVAVYHIPNYGPQHVAQHAIALMLTGARNIIPADYNTHKGNFSYKNFLGISLEGKTLGVIGTGKIGLEVIKIAKSLGMKILAFDIYQNKKAAQELAFKYVTLEDLLKNSDAVTLHIPSTPETKYILNKKTIPLMKKGAILVNTARGDLVDTKALIKNIAKFHAVCLDVLEDEHKFSKNNPLLQFKNVIITPHCAFYTDESLKIIAQETQENIKRFQRGDRTNRVI